MNLESSQGILERLDSIEARLFLLEGGGEGDVDLHVAVHTIFRDLHNVKSSLSMAGADLAASLVHGAESCLDALRSGKAATGRADAGLDWVDPIFALVDHVRGVVEREEDADAPDLTLRLESLLEAWLHGRADEAREIGFPLDPGEAQVLQQAVSSGLHPYIIEKLVGEDLDPAGAWALPIFDAVAESGRLIARRLVGMKGSGAVLTILFATRESREDLSFLVFDPFYPVRESLPPKRDEPVEPRQRLRRILIVDDEPIALILLQNYLAPYGRIDSVEDGLEALERLSSALKAKDPYCVMFLDIMIPGMPGDKVLEEIRRLEAEAGVAPGKGTRIVMASSLADYSTISSAFQNQSDAYLVKPIDAQAIDRTMAKLGFSKIVFPPMPVPSSRKGS